MSVERTRVLWDMADGPMPRGVLGLGSGDIYRDGDSWVLLLGGYSTSFRNRLYSASAPVGSDLALAQWQVRTDRRGRAVALVPDPPRGAWDSGGTHTPSYLAAASGVPARIYYAGRSGRRHVGTGSGYAIGVLEEHEGRWLRRGQPVMNGDGCRRSVLEPRVIRHDGRYIMWYLATPHEVAPGEQPDYELRTTTSIDGLTGWTTPQMFSAASEGFFDVALVPHHERWLLVLARGTNLHSTVPYPPQGLWMLRADRPNPERAAWGKLERLLDADHPETAAWMGRGVCDPAAFAVDDVLTVFVSGTRRYRSWMALTWAMLRRGRRPPVPAPFYLSTAVLQFRLNP